MINWKVRLRNPLFWLTVLPALSGFIYTILGCFQIVPPLSEDLLTQILSAVVTGLTSLGVLVDPTTKGISDSDRAKNYTKPD